jgi:opacity protein-like surface antigen
MTQKWLLAFVSLVPYGICVPAAAQSAAPYAPSPAVAPAEGLYIYARNGQSPTQQATDRYACHSWASQQTGFDSTRPGAGVAGSEYASRRDAYQRAITACLDARGYSVSAVAPAAPAATAPPPPTFPPRYPAPVYAPPLVPQAPELKYHALSVQIDGGYSITAGTTNTNLDDGPNAGFGLTLTPTASLPLALRIDGSYSWFHDRRQFQNQGGAGFTSGHEDIYGGDADLQLDLAHRSTRSKFYLFGGAGWYREETESRQITWVNGTICGFFYCEQGFFPVVTAVARTTSNWHQSWNAGIGWETALADRASFFIEARYLRIKPNNSEMEFVPVRIGLRF